MDILLLVGFLLLVAGIASCAVNRFPGQILAYGGLVVTHFSNWVDFPESTLWTLGIVTFVLTLLHVGIRYWKGRRLRGDNYPVKGCTLGLIVGFVAGPMGLIVGPFIGILLSEWVGRNGTRQFLGQSLTAYAHYVGANGVKWMLSLSLFFYWLSYVIPSHMD